MKKEENKERKEKWAKKRERKKKKKGKKRKGKRRRGKKGIDDEEKICLKIVASLWRYGTLKKHCEENDICWSIKLSERGISTMELKSFTTSFHHVWHIMLEEFTRTKWGYENCIERYKIVHIQRNNFLWLYFVKWEKLICQELGFWHSNGKWGY